MEIPVSQQAATQGWSPAQIITSMEVKELARLAEKQGYPHPAGRAQHLYNQARQRRSEELAVLLGKDKERAAGGTALYLVGGTIMTEEEFTGSKVA